MSAFAILLVALILADNPTLTQNETPAAETASPADADEKVSEEIKDERLSQLAEMWQHRRALATAASYKISGETEHIAGSMVSADEIDPGSGKPYSSIDLPVEDTVTPLTIEWLIDFPQGLFRKKSHNVSFSLEEKAFRPFVRIEVFDGKGLKGLRPRDENSTATYTPHRNQTDVYFWQDEDLDIVAMLWDLPIFFAHGLYGVRPGDLMAAEFESQQLKIVGETQLGDYECLVVAEESSAPSRRIMYYIDMTRGGAILRLEVFNNQDILSDTIDIDYAQHDREWMPSKWTQQSYKGWGEPDENTVSTIRKLVVDSSDLEPTVSLADFQIDLKPGMIVYRHDHDIKEQQVAADGVTLVPFVPIRESESNVTWWRTVLLLNALTLCGALGVWLVARSRKNG